MRRSRSWWVRGPDGVLRSGPHATETGGQLALADAVYDRAPWTKGHPHTAFQVVHLMHAAEVGDTVR